MRRYIVTLSLFLAVGSMVFAQDLARLKADTEKFIGTWKYESTDYSITFILTRGYMGQIELIHGRYKVQKDGQLYESKNVPAPSFFALTLPDGSPNDLFSAFIDNVYHRSTRFSLTMENKRSRTLVFTIISESERDALLPEGEIRKEGTLLPPSGTVFTKQR